MNKQKPKKKTIKKKSPSICLNHQLKYQMMPGRKCILDVLHPYFFPEPVLAGWSYNSQCSLQYLWLL